MGLFDTLGNILGLSGNDPSQGAFDPNDPRFKMDPNATGNATDQIMRLRGRTGAGIDMAQPNDSRMQLGGALDMLRGQATGAAPSVAQNQLMQTTDRGVSQLAGAMSMNRGLNPGTGMRTAMGAGADMLQGANQAAATLRAQEMAQGQNSLVNALNTMRGQDIQQSVGNAQVQTQNQQLINDLLKMYEGQRFDAGSNNLTAALKLAGANTDYAKAQNAAGGGLIGNITNGVRSILGSIF